MTEYEKKLINEYFGNDKEKMDMAISRFEAGEPLAYILGEWGFYGEMYKVTPDTLIPRPDTEHVVDKIIEHLKGREKALLLDLCCGSGCIGISALCNIKTANSSLVAVDVSSKTLEVAKENAIRNGVTENAEFILGDIFSAELQNKLNEKKFDIIASNPPYIKSDVIKTLSSQCQHEPHIALDGGVDGLDFYKELISKYIKLLAPNGAMVLEIGYDQAEDIRNLCSLHNLSVEIFRDYGGNDRVAVIKP